MGHWAIAPSEATPRQTNPMGHWVIAPSEAKLAPSEANRADRSQWDIGQTRRAKPTAPSEAKRAPSEANARNDRIG
jgi:hypothetical protein